MASREPIERWVEIISNPKSELGRTFAVHDSNPTGKDSVLSKDWETILGPYVSLSQFDAVAQAMLGAIEEDEENEQL